MVKKQNFHEKLEADLKRLVVEVEQRRHPPAPERPGRELLKESIRSYAEAVPASPGRVEPEPEAPSPPPPADTPPVPTLSHLPDYAGSGAVPPEVTEEVERLVELVFADGLDAGIREARRHSPFVQDAFHDALVDKLMPELEKRGILK